MLNIQSRSFRWLIAELLIVVLGVLIAFQFEGWRTDREARFAERLALSGIRQDLQSELNDIRRTRDNSQRQYEGTIRLFANLSNLDEASADEIGQSYADIVFMGRWASSSPTYTGLRDSGRLSLISNPQLLRNFSEYFENQIPNSVLAIEAIRSERDSLEATLSEDIFVSSPELINDLDRFYTVGVERPSDVKAVAVFYKPFSEFPRSKMVYPVLSELSLRLIGGGISGLDRLEESTLRLIDQIDSHLATL